MIDLPAGRARVLCFEHTFTLLLSRNSAVLLRGGSLQMSTDRARLSGASIRKSSCICICSQRGDKLHQDSTSTEPVSGPLQTAYLGRIYVPATG